MTSSEIEHAVRQAQRALESFAKIGDSDWTPQDVYGYRCAQDVIRLADTVTTLQGSRPDWPTDLYEAYREKLAERDAVQERLDDALAALSVARLYVEQEYGTKGWQEKLKADQDMIDAVLEA